MDFRKSWAQCYGGHQFGHWAGQLGDGRAISLGEITGPSGQRFELQLKVRLAWLAFCLPHNYVKQFHGKTYCFLDLSQILALSQTLQKSVSEPDAQESNLRSEIIALILSGIVSFKRQLEKDAFHSDLMSQMVLMQWNHSWQCQFTGCREDSLLQDGWWEGCHEVQCARVHCQRSHVPFGSPHHPCFEPGGHWGWSHAGHVLHVSFLLVSATGNWNDLPTW